MRAGKHSEQGQAIIILTISIMALLGFAALAIDGGMVYSDRRHAQNAADAAALAGALQKSSRNTNLDIHRAVGYSLAANGFTGGQASVEISDGKDFMGYYTLVTVELTSTTNTAFAHLFIQGDIQNHVSATARARPSQPPLSGTALAALGACSSKKPVIDIDGGGSGSGILTYHGGIFINSPEPAGSPCAIDLPSSAGSVGIRAHDGARIYSVGAHTYQEAGGKVSPAPVITNTNQGVPLSDPLASLPVPVCKEAGRLEGETHTPGRYGGKDEPAFTGSKLLPGIYCIKGDVLLSGNSELLGTDVVLYFIDGGLEFNGTGKLQLSAPSSDACPEVTTDLANPCTFRGVALYMDRDNTSSFTWQGNGAPRIQGLVYGLNGALLAKGSGSSSVGAWQVQGQVLMKKISTNGNESFVVDYKEELTYWIPPTLSMER